MVHIESMVKGAYPKLYTKIPTIAVKPTLSFLKKLFHEKEINSFLSHNARLIGLDFIEAILEYLHISYKVNHKELENIPEVTNAFLVTGQSADFIVEVVARDMENYSDILLKRIGKIEHVVALHSSFVIKEYNVFNCSGLLSKV